MKHDLETALDHCLESLRQRMDLEGCLASYPEYADDLRPLLDLAIDVGWVSAPAPASGAREAGEQRMLAALATRSERQAHLPPVSRAIRGLISSFARPGPAFGGAWKWAAAMVAILLVVTSGLTLAASGSSLPGDALYPLKMASQRAELALTFDPARQRLLADRFDAQRRSDVGAALARGRQAAVEFRGTLERMEDPIWIVGGLPVAVDEATTVVGQPYLGASLRVRGELPGNGTLLAVWLEVESATTPSPTPSPQFTPTALPSLTPTATGTPRPTGTDQVPQETVPDETAEAGEVDETPWPGLTASPRPDDEGEADGTPGMPAVPEPGHTPELQETPDSIDVPGPGESPEPQDTPASIEEPEPEETPEVEDTPDSIEDPDSDEEPEPEDTPESVEDPDSDEQPEPEDTPESVEDPDSDEQPEPEDTPESAEDPDSNDHPGSDNTPDLPDMPEPGETGESAVIPPQEGSPHRNQTLESSRALFAVTIPTSDKEVIFDDSRS